MSSSQAAGSNEALCPLLLLCPAPQNNKVKCCAVHHPLHCLLNRDVATSSSQKPPLRAPQQAFNSRPFGKRATRVPPSAHTPPNTEAKLPSQEKTDGPAPGGAPLKKQKKVPGTSDSLSFPRYLAHVCPAFLVPSTSTFSPVLIVWCLASTDNWAGLSEMDDRLKLLLSASQDSSCPLTPLFHLAQPHPIRPVKARVFSASEWKLSAVLPSNSHS